MKAKGGRLLAISVDEPAHSRDLAVREGLDFPLLCDTDRRVTREYGLLHAGGGPDGSDIAIPAHLLLDRDGRILWRHVARRIQDRPDPQSVRQIIANKL